MIIIKIMHRFIIIFLIALFGYLNISCWCTGPELNKELIDSSAIIFEGEIISISETDEDTVDGNYYDLITFKILKQYKGEKQKTIVLKHEMTSCGFLNSLHKEKFLNRKCLLYSTKFNGAYYYNMCDNRIVFEKPIKYEFNEVDYKRDVPIYKEEYRKEIKLLNALLKNK